MDSMRGQGGIQKLLTAEQEAKQIVSAARNLKMTRLRQAKEEADREVANRSHLESEHQMKISESSGSSDSTLKRLEAETEEKIQRFKDSASKVGTLAYRLALSPDMSRIHNVFHVSQLRKYISYPSHVLEVEPLLIEENLGEELKYEEVPIRIVDTKKKVLKRKTIPYVKVQCSNHTERGTWEIEEKM